MKLEIGNSSCKLSDITRDQFSELKSKLSYEVEIVTKYGRTIGRKYLLDKRGGFPTGLLYIVEKWIAENKFQVEIKDTRILPNLNPLHKKTLFKKPIGYNPYPEQLEAAKAAVYHKRGIICAPTGVGKSLIISLICEELKVPTLVVVPSLSLKTQVTKGLIEIFGEELVGPLEKGQRKFFITVENVDALSSKPIKGIDCVIVDEFHHSGSRTYRDLNSKAWNDIYYKIGLTATPFRSRDEERLLLESVLSKVIYKIEYKKAVQSGYIVPLEAYYYDLPKKKIEGNKRSWSEMYSELVVHREDRNKLIATLAKNLTSQNISTLVLVKQIEHGAIIKKLCDDSIPFMKGENNEIENRIMLLEFNLKENTTLIGTNGVLGEGIDTKPAEFVIIGGLGKSKNAFMQQVGRVFRKYPGKESGKIILFRDTSHKWTLDHFNAQVQYLQDEYGITPIQLDLELV